jgi:REP element-mobilizing transposase RayT
MLARRIIMPRGNRYYIPGLIWHITHRCHKKEFLLKFARDPKCWLRWLYEAKKRYALTILNFTVTSNHIHLLVQDTGHRNFLSKAIQLVAGRTAQAYNMRKKRKGAFWEDRYHATAVQDDKGGHTRDAKWRQSIAVGSKVFIEDVKDQQGYKAIGRKIVKAGDIYQLKERQASYNCDFGNKMSPLRVKNSFNWNVYPINSV